MINRDNFTDADWSATFDAEALARAEMIKADPSRYKKAIAMAEKLVEEKDDQAEAMEKVVKDAKNA